MEKKIGRIKTVDLREVFKNEAREFTPWLEQNIDQLSDALGIGINDIKRETRVGDFNADLIGIEENSENKIIIENQLEQTDHDHLGKLITYASGMDARYVVWISKKIREEHKSALEWLNRLTVSESTSSATAISFFGVEINAISIDNSPPALNFDVIVEPNSWEREVKSNTTQIDERHAKYLYFFTRLVAEYEKVKPEWGYLTPRPSSWLAFGAGKTGFRFTWSFRGDNQFAVELYIDTRDKDETKKYFAELQKYRTEIDGQIPALLWEELPERRGARISMLYKMPRRAKELMEEEINLIIKWAIINMDLFKKVFSSYIQGL